MNCISAKLAKSYLLCRCILRRDFEACLGIRVIPSHLNFTSLPLLNWIYWAIIFLLWWDLKETQLDGLARPTVSQLRPPACYRPTVLYCTVHCYSLLYCTEHCNSLLHCTVLYTYTALYCSLYTVTAHLARSHESIEGGQLGIGRKGQPTPENGWPASTMRRCRRHPEYNTNLSLHCAKLSFLSWQILSKTVICHLFTGKHPFN